MDSLKEDEGVDGHNLLETLQQRRLNLCEAARLSSQKEIKEGMQEEMEITSEYNINDIVMRGLQPFEKVDKLDSNWSGPFRVVECYKRGGFNIENLNGKLFKINIRDIKRMNGTDPDEWEAIKEGGMLAEEQACLALNTFIN
ncbi:hypothetical protein ENBRE01_1687 [Enteropsectra breve]|nr:hypothetical protein ENBRE01_1687 [Enteropsectra breve]